jgi:hypothetical protein
MKLLDRGYWVLDLEDLGAADDMNVAVTMVTYGHVAKARKLIEAYPQFGALANSFGVTASEMIEAVSSSKAALPQGVVAATKALPLGAQEVASVAAPYGDGGWPTGEVPFPGEPDGGACEIAEIDGASVVADPQAFVREFVLMGRPVMVRDFVRHDPVMSHGVGKVAGSARSLSWKSQCLQRSSDHCTPCLF